MQVIAPCRICCARTPFTQYQRPMVPILVCTQAYVKTVPPWPRGFLSRFPSVQFMYICRDHIYIGHIVTLGRTQVYLPRSEPHSGATLSGRTPEPQSSSNTCALQGAQSIRSRKCISGCYIFGYYPLRTDSAAFTMLSHAFLM